MGDGRVELAPSQALREPRANNMGAAMRKLLDLAVRVYMLGCMWLPVFVVAGFIKGGRSTVSDFTLLEVLAMLVTLAFAYAASVRLAS